MKNYADIIFKTYDIRGKYPSELNEKVAEDLGRSVCIYISRKYTKKHPKFIICRDGRRSSESLKQALVRGILEQGGDVMDSGLGTAPFFYFLMRTLRADGGVIVTASHNPREFNGFKVRARDNRAVAMGGGLETVKKIFVSKKATPVSSQIGQTISYQDLTEEYLNLLSKEIKIQPLNIVIDAGGGTTSLFLPKLLSNFPAIKYKPISFKIDPDFRLHSPNPLLPEAQQFVRKEMQNRRYHFGAVFDGDGDRVIFFDEMGKPISAEFVFLLLALEELKTHPRSFFVVPPAASKSIREAIGEAGGRLKFSKVGYAFVKKAMQRCGARIGVEKSGHFHFRYLKYDDSGLYTFLRLASLVSRQDRPLSRLVASFVRYITSDQIDFHVRDQHKVIKSVRDFYAGKGKLSTLDGIIIEFDGWWFHLRPSNTELVVRLVVEAEDERLFKEKVAELTRLIKKES